MAWNSQKLCCILNEQGLYDIATVMENSNVQSASYHIELVNGKEIKTVSKQEIIPLDELALRGVSDIATLSVLNEATIFHNLKSRYEQDIVYTNVGDILIALNPFKDLCEQDDEVLGKLLSKHATNEPHIYSLANKALDDLTKSGKDQSIIISGESGSGKTETTKQVLKFISAKSTTNHGLVQQRVFEASVLLEVFGNAKTTQNDNSSRFGKMIELSIDAFNGEVKAAKISTYLLEKSRVTHCGLSQKTFHCFYSLVQSALKTNEIKQSFLFGEGSYNYLGDASSTPAKFDFECVTKLLENLHFSPSEQVQLWSVIAAILHLGNISFEEDGEDSHAITSSNAEISRAAKLLRVNEEDLRASLLKTKVLDSFKLFNVQEAQDGRDAFTKALYEKLFNWIVEKINLYLRDTTLSSLETIRTIRLLDVFGFEIFAVNSLEQLCINFCNEKLHGFFIENVISKEQELYQQEGILNESVVKSHDIDVLDILLRPRGIFDLLDVQCQIRNGTDIGFVNNIKKSDAIKAVNSSNAIKFPRPRRTTSGDASLEFTIRHFAGEVTYSSIGFVIKNTDPLNKGFTDLCRDSKSVFVQKLFQTGGDIKVKTKTKQTVTRQFRNGLRALFAQLETTEKHFVRTILPNSTKKSSSFRDAKVLQQLRCLGLTHICEVRKRGYSYRTSHEEFVHRFRCLFPGISGTADSLAKAIEQYTSIQTSQFKVGKSLVFLETDGINELVSARTEKLATLLTRVQALYRSHVTRRKYCAFLQKRQAIEIEIQSNKELMIENPLLEVLVTDKETLSFAGPSLLHLLLLKTVDSNRIDLLTFCLSMVEHSCFQRYPLSHETAKLAREIDSRSKVLAAMLDALESKDAQTIEAILTKKPVSFVPNSLITKAQEIIDDAKMMELREIEEERKLEEEKYHEEERIRDAQKSLEEAQIPGENKRSQEDKELREKRVVEKKKLENLQIELTTVEEYQEEATVAADMAFNERLDEEETKVEIEAEPTIEPCTSTKKRIMFAAWDGPEQFYPHKEYETDVSSISTAASSTCNTDNTYTSTSAGFKNKDKPQRTSLFNKMKAKYKSRKAKKKLIAAIKTRELGVLQQAVLYTRNQLNQDELAKVNQWYKTAIAITEKIQQEHSLQLELERKYKETRSIASWKDIDSLVMSA